VLDYEPLDDLRAGVFIAEMFWADALVEQHWRVGSFALLEGNDDSGHGIDLLQSDPAVVCDPPSDTLLRRCEGVIKPA
jgi:hypothetical protein